MLFRWLREREERRQNAYLARARFVDGLVWRYYDGDPPNSKLPEPGWGPDVELVEFGGDRFTGADVVRRRLLARAGWAHARWGRGGSWTIQPIGKFHVIATRAPVSSPEQERQPQCVLVDAREGKIVRIREFQDAEEAHRSLREAGVYTPPP
jgi:hypothetical protein